MKRKSGQIIVYCAIAALLGLCVYCFITREYIFGIIDVVMCFSLLLPTKKTEHNMKNILWLISASEAMVSCFLCLCSLLYKDISWVLFIVIGFQILNTVIGLYNFVKTEGSD